MKSLSCLLVHFLARKGGVRYAWEWSQRRLMFGQLSIRQMALRKHHADDLLVTMSCQG